MLEALVLALAAAPVPDQPVQGSGEDIEIAATSRELLAMATRAVLAQQEDLAITMLEALTKDPELAIRNEARFRLAMLAMRHKDWMRAGLYLRAILDEEPTAQRARVELARVQAELGDHEAARRSLREAQAGELPPNVARVVERFSAALRDRNPVGATLQLAIAPDSNVNRATRSDTLGTVIGDFDLDEDAQETSGIGLSVKTEAYYRLQLSSATSLLARAGFSGNFYRTSRFDDMVGFASLGPEFPFRRGRANLSLGARRRWFGGETYADALTANFDWQGAAGPRAQIRAGLGYARTDNRLNDSQDGDEFSAFASYERALSTRSGVSVTIGGMRQLAKDPAYSLASLQLSATGWREFGSTTLFASASYQHLEADERLAIYPERRREDFARVSLGITNRKIEWQGFSPLVRVAFEKNWSPIEVYSFDRWSGEFGVVRAF